MPRKRGGTIKDVIPVDWPLFEIDPKAYLYGTDVVALAHAADRALKEHGATVVLTSPILEARAATNNAEHILVCVPYLDPIRPGRGVMDILLETPVEAGVCMVMLNHTRHPITFTVLEKTMQHATEAGLATAVYASSLAKVRAVASLGSGLLIAEPIELVGTDKPSGFDYAEAPNRAAREVNPGVYVLQGVEISTPADIGVVIRNGTDATGLSSAITTTPGPSVMAEAMARTACRGWDTRPRL